MTGPRNFIKVIDSTGSSRRFKATIDPEGEGAGRESHRKEEIKQYFRSFLWSLIFTTPVFLTSMVFMYIPGIKHGLDTKVVNMLTIGEVIRWVLSTPVQFLIGRRFYTGSYKALRHGSANMDVLIALGTNAAYFYSVYTVIRAASSPDFEGTDFFETSAMLISFILQAQKGMAIRLSEVRLMRMEYCILKQQRLVQKVHLHRLFVLLNLLKWPKLLYRSLLIVFPNISCLW